MPEPYLERSILSPLDAPRTAALMVTIGAAIFASVTLSCPAGAQSVAQSDAAAQARYEAPIGHRQPRLQDLPPGVRRDEDRLTAGQEAFDKKLENRICRGC